MEVGLRCLAPCTGEGVRVDAAHQAHATSSAAIACQKHSEASFLSAPSTVKITHYHISLLIISSTAARAIGSDKTLCQSALQNPRRSLLAPLVISHKKDRPLFERKRSLAFIANQLRHLHISLSLASNDGRFWQGACYFRVNLF